MLVGPELFLAPVVGILLSRGQRTSLGLISIWMFSWLNLWWLLPLLGYTAELPRWLSWARTHPALTVLGHIGAIVVALAALGVFSPRPGSPRELAIRAARRGDHLAAGEFWLEARRPGRAYRSFSRARAWARAAEVARSGGRLRRAAGLLQREGGASLGVAAQLYARLGEEGQAQQLWLRFGHHLVEARQPDLAVEPFLRAGDVRRAANAAELALQQQRITPANVEAAIKAARESRRPSLAAALAVAGGRFREAGDLYLAASMPDEAARAFERASEPMRAAEALRLAGREEDAARLRAQRLASGGQFEQAAQEYASAGMLAEAANALLKLGRFAEAAEVFHRAGRLREAADILRAHGDAGEAAKLYLQLEDWADAGAAFEMAGNDGEAARAYEQAGDFERALELYPDAGLVAEQARLLAQIGRVEEGFRVLYDRAEFAQAWDLLAGYGGTFPGLTEPLLKIAEWQRSNGDLPAAISAIQRATAGLPVTRELLQPLLRLAQLFEEHGDLRAAEKTLQRVVEFDYSFADVAARLQDIAARRVAEESQMAATPRPGTTEPVTPPPDASSRYVLEQELGRGGMGVVYRAFDQRLGRTVAIKVLNPRQHTPEALRRFEREARAAAALSHPGIVHIYDFDRGFESFYISMEYVAGHTLSQLLKEEPAFVRHNLTPLLRQIADAVAYAHARQVVHRDLKPANMILADRRQVKILDFGIARRLDELELSSSGATGTPYYMAPEQILGEDPDERTDVYSLGVSFFQMATGRLPFTSGNVLRSHLDQAPPDPQELNPNLEASISHVILRCLAKDPAQRYRDGGALLAALSSLAGESGR
ncbi:MAG: protein kinase [Acidobacteriota bacterium]